MVFKLFGCLKIHFMENQFRCLVRSNIFIENALHSQAIQFFIHFLNCKHVDNESIPHSFIKETKPSKKRKSNPVKLRSRGGGGEIGGEIEATRSSGAVLWSTINAVRSSDWSLVCGRRRSLFFLSLCDLGSLSLSVEILWSENQNWNHFPPVKPYFMIKLKIFSIWPNLPDLPICYFPENDFWISFEVKTNGPLVTNWIILLWVCVGFMFSFGWPFFNCWLLWVKGRPMIGSYPPWHQPTLFLFFFLLLLLLFFFS